jgi:O-antigen ligase
VAEGSSPGATADRTIRRALAVLVFVAPLLVIPGNYDAANLPQTAFIDVSACLLLVLYSLRSRALGALDLPPRAVLWPLVLFLAWAGLSLLWAANPHEGAPLLRHFAACALVYVVAASALRDEAAWTTVLTALVAAGALVALLGIAQHTFGVTAVPQAFPPAATFANKNVAAGFEILVIPIAVGLALGVPGRALPFALIAALLAAYVFDTGTRSAGLALVVETAVFFGLGRPRVRLGRALLAGGGLLVLLSFLGPRGFENRPLVAYRTLVRPLFTERESASPPASVMSVRARFAIFRKTIPMIGDAPFRGVGLGNHRVVYPRYALRPVPDPLFAAGRELDFAHDDYLQVAAELGLVGLVLALVLVYRVVGPGVAQARGDLGRLAALVGIAGLATDALFGFPTYRALPPLLAALFAARLLPDEREPARPLARAQGTLLVLVSAALTLGVLAVEARAFLADRHIMRMMGAASLRAAAEERAEAEAAERLDPSRKEPYFFLGNVFLAAGEPDHAAEALAREVALYPYDREALGNLGLAYAGANDAARALAADRRLEAIDPRDASLHARMTLLLESLKQWHEGLGEARLAVLYEPQNPQYQYRRGILALQDHSMDEAQGALEEALRIDPRMARAHKALGVLLLNDGHPKEAVAHFEQALLEEPDIQDAAHMREVIDRFRPRK